MDSRVALLLEKVKVVAGKTSQAAGRAAESAGKLAGDMAQATRLNLQIFDVNTECEILYKEIGKMVYDIHMGCEVSNDQMDERIEKLDGLTARADELRAQLADMKQTCTCPGCGKQCSKDDVFCASCGATL